MELQDRKNMAFAAFRRHMQDMAFESGQVRSVKDRATISFSDGSRALLIMSTVKGGFGKGEFGVYPSLCIYGGPIYRIMKDTRLEGGSTYSEDMIFAGSYHSLVPRRSDVYAFRASADVEAVVTTMMRDVRRFFVPIVQQFAGKYGEAVDFILSHEGAHVRKPFAMCVILLGLANAFDRLDEVVAEAKKNKGFWDFHKTKNYESIVQRIRKWFEKNKGRTGPS